MDTKRGAGLAVSLNYVFHGKTNFQGMAMELQLPSEPRPQQALLDLGSASIAFCNRSLVSGVQAQKTTYAQCNAYGNSVPVSDFISPVAFEEYYYASIYQGDVQALSAKDGQVVADMKDVSYAIMDYQVNMTCGLGYDAIFGIAFDGLNSANIVPDGDASLMIEKVDPNASFSLATCNYSYPSKDLPSPIMQSMWAEGEHRYGLYVNFTAISKLAESGLSSGVHKDMGTLYVGPEAVENPIYEACTDKGIAKTWIQSAWWNFRLKSVALTPTAWYPDHEDFPSDFCATSSGNSNCLFDSGNPNIVMPKRILVWAANALERARNVCAVGAHVQCPGSKTMCSGDQCCPKTEQTGNKTFPCPSAPAEFTNCENASQVDTCVLPGHTDGGVVPDVTINFAVLKDPRNLTSETSTLSLSAAFLLKLHDLGFIGFGEQVVMGLPFFAQHYAVFDDDADTMTWCTKQGE